MAEVRQTVDVEADPEEVWQVIGDPASLANWHPGVSGSRVEGDERFVTLAEGGEIHERILEQSGDSYSYEFLESPLPVHDYRSSVSVSGDDGRTTITWEGSFGVDDGAQEDEMTGAFNRIYRAGLEAVADRFH